MLSCRITLSQGSSGHITLGKTASLVTNPWGGGQPQGNESDAGQDRPVSREERVGHRQCPGWSGYARQAVIVGAAEVSG